MTWAIDPDLVETVADMGDDNGYQVATPDNGTVAGRRRRAGPAAGWTGCGSRPPGEDVLPLPYADPDLVALTDTACRVTLGHGPDRRRHGPGRAAAAASLVDRHRLADRRLPRPGHPGRPRPGGRDRDRPGRPGPAHRPSTSATRRPAGRRLAPLRADRGAARRPRRWPTCSPGPGRGPVAVLAAQRFLAETAMITSELPSTGTGAHHRGDAAAPLGPAAGVPRPAGRTVGRGAVGRAGEPARAGRGSPRRRSTGSRCATRAPQRRAELPTSTTCAPSAPCEAGIDNFRGVLTDPRPAGARQQRPADPGLQSSQPGSSRPGGVAATPRSIRLDREKRYLKATARARCTCSPGSFTFGSKSGMIPLTIVNGLTQEVAVVLRLDPQTPRLRSVRVEPQTIGPNQKLQVPVPAERGRRRPGRRRRAAAHQRRGALRPAGAAAGHHHAVSARWRCTSPVAAAVVLFLAAGIRVVAGCASPGARRRAGRAGPGQSPPRCRHERHRPAADDVPPTTTPRPTPPAGRPAGADCREPARRHAWSARSQA